jgi:hypothetical protein
VRSKLPVVTSEIGDSWLYGCGSDPLKVQTMAALARHHDACIADVGCVKAEPHFRDFQRLLVLAGKHTWGGADIYQHTRARTHTLLCGLHASTMSSVCMSMCYR